MSSSGTTDPAPGGGSSAARPRIDVVYFDAGSGHRSGALGLAAALERQFDVDARAVDILDVIRGHRVFHSTVRAGIDYFNFWLRRERVWDLKGLINLSLICHDLVSHRGEASIAEYWKAAPPASVVSVTPMYNPVLARALHRVRPNAPYVVVPVDFEEGKPRYWFDGGSDLHYVLTQPRQREQAIARGVAPERIGMASGMVVDPAFHDAPTIDRENALIELGLDPERPTGVVSFGGQGSVLVEECVRALEMVERPLNLIVLCGRHAALHERLGELPSRHRLLVLGFQPEPPVLHHQVADFLIGKPGSMTITEGVLTGTPVLAIRARGMWVVQRGNERWLEEKGAGEVVPTPRDLPAAVQRVLSHPDLPVRLDRLRHDGVFSAARLIGEISGLETTEHCRRPGKVLEALSAAAETKGMW